MTDPITSDRAQQAAKYALTGLARKEELIGHNLANVDTPGYRARALDFQTALRQKLSGPEGVRMKSTHAAHIPVSGQDALSGDFQAKMRQGGSQRADGNNVDIDVELTEMAETGIHYQALTQLVSKKFLLLRSIITGR